MTNDPEVEKALVTGLNAHDFVLISGTYLCRNCTCYSPEARGRPGPRTEVTRSWDYLGLPVGAAEATRLNLRDSIALQKVPCRLVENLTKKNWGYVLYEGIMRTRGLPVPPSEDFDE